MSNHHRNGDTKGDDLPPHDDAAEAGVLGCILLDPEPSIAECIIKLRKVPEVFYDVRHQALYRTLLAMDAELEPVDALTLQSRLKKKGTLLECGGVEYLSQLPDAAP